VQKLSLYIAGRALPLFGFCHAVGDSPGDFELHFHTVFADVMLLSCVLCQAVGDSPDDLNQLQLTTLDTSSIQQAMQCISLQQQQQQQLDGEQPAAAAAEDLSAALGNLSCAGDEEEAAGSSKQQRRLPCLQVAAVEGDEASGVQLVSGWLAAALRICVWFFSCIVQLRLDAYCIALELLTRDKTTLAISIHYSIPPFGHDRSAAGALSALHLKCVQCNFAICMR
jgi:hypothetical protein